MLSSQFYSALFYCILFYFICSFLLVFILLCFILLLSSWFYFCFTLFYFTLHNRFLHNDGNEVLSLNFPYINATFIYTTGDRQTNRQTDKNPKQTKQRKLITFEEEKKNRKNNEKNITLHFATPTIIPELISASQTRKTIGKRSRSFQRLSYHW